VNDLDLMDKLQVNFDKSKNAIEFYRIDWSVWKEIIYDVE
jgi:hypothetical protein